MRNFLPFLLLSLFGNFVVSSSTQEDSKDCKKIKATSASARLMSHIKCEYYNLPYGEPILNSDNVTNVYIYLFAHVLHFDDYLNNLEFNGFFIASWTDDSLKWNNASYDNITSITVHTGYIWTPDIAFLSPGHGDSAEYRFNNEKCLLVPNGHVLCQIDIHRSISCQTDYRLWPYDRHNCTIVITSWAYSSEQIKLTTPDTASIMDMFRSNGEWNYSVSRISNEERKSYYYENVSSSQIAIDIVVDRMHSHLRGRYIAPAIIMMSMTLTTLWLDPKSIERLAIGSLNIIIHMLCIQNLHWALPHNGATIPCILLFYVNSFVLATLALPLTYLSGKIKETKISTPKWISISTGQLLKSKTGQLLVLGMLDPKAAAGIDIGDNDNTVLMSSESKETAWTYVAILFGWMSFIGFLFAYVIMYAVLIPNSATNSPIEAMNNYDRLDNQFGVGRE